MEQPPASPVQTIGIKEAATAFGVSVDTVRRRIKDGKLPEADLIEGKYGETYELPMGDLLAIAEREGWVLDLTDGSAQGSPSAAHTQDAPLADLVERVIAAETSAETTAMQLAQTEKERDQARSDLEQERTERQRLETDLIELDKAKAVAETRTDEVRTQLQGEQARVAEHQAQLTEASELAAERAAAHAEELVSMGDRATEMERLASERLSEVAKLKESMGWWSRRRYEKNQ